jgi:two-component system, OmpR family, phosphate regulon response regulator OmpR
MAITVLVVDDNPKIRELLTEYLEIVGMKVIALADGERVMEAIETHHPDVVILDIIMPGQDGFNILKSIKRKHVLPVIMLTARGEVTDKIVGLELGADDYLTKPFNSRELEARIKATLRAYRSVALETEHDVLTSEFNTTGNTISEGCFILNIANQTLSINESETLLSTMENKLLKALMSRPKQIFSRETLINIINDDSSIVAFDRSIDAHVSRLRAKIKATGGDPESVKTIRGSGYMFVSEQS